MVDRSLRLAITLGATVVTFFLGYFATSAAYKRWVVPEWVRQYPHDGQIGLAVFLSALKYAGISAAIVLFLGILWIVSPAKSNDAERD